MTTNNPINAKQPKTSLGEANIGDDFHNFLLVKNAQSGSTVNGAPYINTTLGDATGEVTAMIWNADDNKKAVFQTGNIAKIKGNIIDYRGSKQINIQDFRLAQDGENIDMDSLILSAPIKGDTLFTLIVLEVSNMKNEKIKHITLDILNKYREQFKTHPAAKSVHHGYRSGLAYHTYSMMNVGKKMAELYPALNRDLLLAGIILHDIGKIIEYSYENQVAIDTTLEGRLKGHISIMSEEVGRTAEILDIQGEEVLLLQHMILSHHGLAQNGWGSPVSPLVIEAHVLHQIDMLDAGLDAYRHAVKSTEKGEFTNRIFGLDNRSFYVPKI